MDERDPGAGRPRRVEVPGLSPVRAFFVVGALAALPVALLATRDAEPSTGPRPAVTSSPSFELTDAEAIAEFERLNEQLMAAYRERNIALAEDVFTSSSPMLPRVAQEIRTLVRRSVWSRSRFEEITTEIDSNGPQEIIVERVEILFPRFETNNGRNASQSSSPERQRVRWTLRFEKSKWLLHDALVLERRILKGSSS